MKPRLCSEQGRFNWSSLCRGYWLILIIWASSHLPAPGAILISLEQYDLLPNKPGQIIEVLAQNTGSVAEKVSGLSLNVQVGDSGPESGLGSVTGPHITGVDILTGTLFQSNNTGAQNGGSVPQFANWTTTTASGTVSLDAGATTKLGTFTLDTTGFVNPQSWTLSLGNTINGSTKYFDALGGSVVPTITDGTLTVVPEVHGFGMVVGSMLLAWGCWRRQTRSSHTPLGGEKAW